MNYLITIAIQFFRWALAWVARELVLLIVMALVSSFFAEFRQLLLTFMDLIKDKIFILFNQIESLSNELESSIKKISSNLEKLSTKVTNSNIFLVEKLDHNKKANVEHANKFKINDIYRILVDNFDRDERIALALRFAKKDHFRLKE